MDKFEQTRRLAYQLWESEGRPDGKHMDHWFKAEQIIFGRSEPEARRAQPAAAKAPRYIEAPPQAATPKPAPKRARATRAEASPVRESPSKAKRKTK